MTVDMWVAAEIKALEEKYNEGGLNYSLDYYDNTYTIFVPKRLYDNPEFLLDEHRIYKEFFKLFPYTGLFITAL